MELSTVLLAIVTLLCTTAIYLIRRRMNYWKVRGIVHDEPHFLRGNFQELQKTLHLQDIYQRYYNKYKGSGPFAGFYFFQKPSVFVLDLELAKNVLVKDFANFADRPAYYNEKDDPLSAHLFALNSGKWKNLRHKLTPTFTSGKMKFMFPTVVKVGNEFVKVLDEMISKPGNSTVEVKELFARFTTDIIGTCAFGIDCNSLKDPEAEFRVMGRRAFTERKHSNLVMGLALSFPEIAKMLGIGVFTTDVTTFFMKAVRETIAYREANNVKRNDFMDLLLEIKNSSKESAQHMQITIEEMAAQSFVFFLAGFETSSTTGSFALYELALHQDVQDRAREEINEALAKHKEFTYECMKDMKYLDQILSETLRLYTVVPALMRRCLKTYPVPGQPKYVIESGTPVIIPATAIHRDADIYPNPDKFNPDNFTPEKIQSRDNVCWLPFGDGPRNCIGMRFGMMQSRIGLALLLKNFKFSVAPETVVPIEIDIKSNLCASKGGIYLKVERV